MGVVQITLDLHELVAQYDRDLATITDARLRAVTALGLLEGDSVDQLEEEVAAAPTAATPTLPVQPEPEPSRNAWFDDGLINWPVVIEVANSGIADGESPYVVLMSTFNVPRSTANNWVSKMRRDDALLAGPLNPILPATPEPTVDPGVWTPDRARDVLDGAA